MIMCTVYVLSGWLSVCDSMWFRCFRMLWSVCIVCVKSVCVCVYYCSVVMCMFMMCNCAWCISFCVMLMHVCVWELLQLIVVNLVIVYVCIVQCMFVSLCFDLWISFYYFVMLQLHVVLLFSSTYSLCSLWFEVYVIVYDMRYCFMLFHVFMQLFMIVYVYSVW